jgi:hypothetical protein
MTGSGLLAQKRKRWHSQLPYQPTNSEQRQYGKPKRNDGAAVQKSLGSHRGFLHCVSKLIPDVGKPKRALLSDV